MDKSNDVKAKEWLELLKALKQRVTEKDLFFKRTVFENSKLNFQWHNFLISKNILIKDENELYKWNEKIPVTIQIIKAYREYSSEKNNKQKAKSKMKSIPIPKDVRQKEEVNKKQCSKSYIGEKTKKIKAIIIRLSENDYEFIHNRAKEKGSSLSNLVRKEIIDNMKLMNEEKPKPKQQILQSKKQVGLIRKFWYWLY
jgi:hypothetical protein